jgi:putative ABC transport system permease protein
MTSLHDVVEPLIIRHYTPADQLLIKVSGHNIRSTIDDIHHIWNAMIGKTEIDYAFLDQHFQQQYEKDEKRGNLFASFSGMIIFIACLGLFGLASFTAEQRTKEIGIRKVMGASVTHILVLLSKDYMQLLIISMVIAIPVANYFITDWLKGFAYKIPLQWWMFVLPGIMVLWVALMSISGKTIRVARKNPVDSLRYE